MDSHYIVDPVFPKAASSSAVAVQKNQKGGIHMSRKE